MTNKRVLLGLMVALGALATSVPANAQPGPHGESGPEELARLEGILAEEVARLHGTLAHPALATTDCALACRALGSIRRAAEAICELDKSEPAGRCQAARGTADDAARRVRDACPDCALAPTRPPAAAVDGSPTAKIASAPVAPASVPAAESRRGGCAGCTAAPKGGADVGALGLSLGALALLVRRRRASSARRW